MDKYMLSVAAMVERENKRVSHCYCWVCPWVALPCRTTASHVSHKFNLVYRSHGSMGTHGRPWIPMGSHDQGHKSPWEPNSAVGTHVGDNLMGTQEACRSVCVREGGRGCPQAPAGVFVSIVEHPRAPVGTRGQPWASNPYSNQSCPWARPQIQTIGHFLGRQIWI